MITAERMALLARYAVELDQVTPERAAIRIRGLVNAVQLGDDPRFYLLAIAAIAIAAADQIDGAPVEPPRLRQ